MPIRVKKIYEAMSNDAGYRVSADRLWPRGIKKKDAQIGEWLKDVAPARTLRKWFGHQAEKWELLYRRYSAGSCEAVFLAQLKLSWISIKQ